MPTEPTTPRRRPRPPGGHPPPTEARLPDGSILALTPLAQEICRRYREEFPDEEERYGEVGQAWCVHDNQHILNWAAGTVRGIHDFSSQISWLARVLEAREFPLERLARNLEIAAGVVNEQAPEGAGEASGVLAEGARLIASRDSFLDP